MLAVQPENTEYNTNITEIENEILDTSGLVKKTNFYQRLPNIKTRYLIPLVYLRTQYLAQSSQNLKKESDATDFLKKTNF